MINTKKSRASPLVISDTHRARIPTMYNIQVNFTMPVSPRLGVQVINITYQKKINSYNWEDPPETCPNSKQLENQIHGQGCGQRTGSS